MFEREIREVFLFRLKKHSPSLRQPKQTATEPVVYPEEMYLFSHQNARKSSRKSEVGVQVPFIAHLPT
jgi:hypothetical protein